MMGPSSSREVAGVFARTRKIHRTHRAHQENEHRSLEGREKSHCEGREKGRDACFCVLPPKTNCILHTLLEEIRRSNATTKAQH